MFRVRYGGVIGVPITLLGRACPEQFDTLGTSRYHDGSFENNDINFIDGKQTFTRILIRRR